jgi:signal transduction histidine kinase
MAKETAHQLGTPISAIIAWLEILKSNKDPEDAEQEIISELYKDVDRLNLIADRFSKIGSKPVLQQVMVHDTLSRVVNYMKRRAPRNVKFIFTKHAFEDGHEIWVNPHLFEWVIENLIRNALDAMESKGNIIFDVTKKGGWININISDTGKGISPKSMRKIFDPGYSTKKRGWGLGLSLAKRIVENYHHGKIFVKETKPNEGTTFTIQLPEKMDA